MADQSAMLLFVVLYLSATILTIQGSEANCKIDNKTIDAGEQYDAPGHCALMVCKGDDKWTQAACGLLGAPKGWTFVPENTSKPYPKCCGYAIPPLDIVPDVLDKVPGTDYLEIMYEGGLLVDQGNELTPTQVKNQPAVHWYNPDPESYYLLCMTDPDAPSRKNPTNREFKHWLVGNIPGDDIGAGEVLTEYVGSGPPKDTGLHRYVFLLYKQPGRLTFDEPKVSKTSRDHRAKFLIRKFAQKYNLGDPIAINVYQAQYDDYVPTVHKQLSGK